MIQGSASQYAGQGKAIQAAWQYLNPAIASSSVLFSEINRDTSQFTNFIVKTEQPGHRRLPAQQRPQRRWSSTCRPPPARWPASATALGRVDPAPARVHAPGQHDVRQPAQRARRPHSRWSTRQSRWRPSSRSCSSSSSRWPSDSVPTVRDLANIISRPGPEQRPDRADQARRAARRRHRRATSRPNGKLRPGAFPRVDHRAQRLDARAGHGAALRGRPDRLVRGLHATRARYDANGGSSRVAPIVGVGSLQNGALNLLPAFTDPAAAQHPGLRRPRQHDGHRRPARPTGQGDRCPGSMERGGAAGLPGERLPV